MPITWRPATAADLLACLELQPAQRGAGLVGLEAALQVWKRLQRDPFFVSSVFEADPPICGHRLVGFGASVFVSAEFMDAEIAHPRPDINSRLIASVHRGQSVLLTREEIGRANAGGGVDILIPYGTWREEIMSPDEAAEARTAVPMAFTELHAGFRIRRILWETLSGPQERFARSSGVYEAIGEFPELGRVLNLTAREDAFGVPASLANVLFRYNEPVLGLRKADQELLQAALPGGATDVELATALGLKMPAVKARWRSAFARIAEARPNLVEDQHDGEGRGAQKRHRVLAYVREHPEELRPYAGKRPGRRKDTASSGERNRHRALPDAAGVDILSH